jgi:hypothetical protein
VSEHAHRPFPWRITAFIAGVVLLATGVAGVLLSRDRMQSATPDDATIFTPAPQLLPLDKQRQVTMLLTVRDDQRSAVSTVLIGMGGDTGFVSELLLPRDLLLPTVPPIRLARVTDPTGSTTAEEPLETLLGVQIDAVIDLDRLAWSGLIDATGSRVDLTAAESPGSFPLVLDRVLVGLPDDEQSIGGLLTGLGSMARTTVTNEDAGYLLGLLGQKLRDTEVRREALPVTYVRGGSRRVAVAELATTTAVTRELFPRALLQPGHAGQPRVVLQRAGASLGATVAVRADLAAAGFGVIADQQDLPASGATAVLVPDDSEAAIVTGRDVARGLGLPESSVQVDPAADAIVDVRVVLGSDATVAP